MLRSYFLVLRPARGLGAARAQPQGPLQSSAAFTRTLLLRSRYPLARALSTLLGRIGSNGRLIVLKRAHIQYTACNHHATTSANTQVLDPQSRTRRSETDPRSTRQVYKVCTGHASGTVRYMGRVVCGLHASGTPQALTCLWPLWATIH
jgi:hypothetical protein